MPASILLELEEAFASVATHRSAAVDHNACAVRSAVVVEVAEPGRVWIIKGGADGGLDVTLGAAGQTQAERRYCDNSFHGFPC